jgi:hypothetical protein
MPGGRDGEELHHALDQTEHDRGDDGVHGFVNALQRGGRFSHMAASTYSAP